MRPPPTRRVSRRARQPRSHAPGVRIELPEPLAQGRKRFRREPADLVFDFLGFSPHHLRHTASPQSLPHNAALHRRLVPRGHGDPSSRLLSDPGLPLGAPVHSHPVSLLGIVPSRRFAILVSPSLWLTHRPAGSGRRSMFGSARSRRRANRNRDGRVTSRSEPAERLRAGGQRRGLIPKRCCCPPALPAGRGAPSLPAPGRGAGRPLHDRPRPPRDLSP